MAFLDTLVNTFGGQLFDMDWKPQLESEPWKKAVTFYVDLLNKYGPPGRRANGFNENLALFSQRPLRACGSMPPSRAGFIYDPKQSKVADKVGFAQAPIERDAARAATGSGPGRWRSRSLARRSRRRKKFIEWATSKDYIKLVGEKEGWVIVPPGTRKSHLRECGVSEGGPVRQVRREGHRHRRPDSTRPRTRPYTGVQFAAIPEFQAIGTQVGQQIAAALAGQSTVDQALKTSQDAPSSARWSRRATSSRPPTWGAPAGRPGPLADRAEAQAIA